MTFKLTEKDIEIIETVINAFASGVPTKDIVAKHGGGHTATLRGFLGQLRKLGVFIPKRSEKGKRSKEWGDKISVSMSKRWAALRELEAREAAR